MKLRNELFLITSIFAFIAMMADLIAGDAKMAILMVLIMAFNLHMLSRK